MTVWNLIKRLLVRLVSGQDLMGEVVELREKVEELNSRQSLMALDLAQAQRMAAEYQAKEANTLREMTDWITKIRFGIGCFSGQTLQEAHPAVTAPAPLSMTGRVRARDEVDKMARASFQEDRQRTQFLANMGGGLMSAKAFEEATAKMEDSLGLMEGGLGRE